VEPQSAPYLEMALAFGSSSKALTTHLAFEVGGSLTRVGIGVLRLFDRTERVIREFCEQRSLCGRRARSDIESLSTQLLLSPSAAAVAVVLVTMTMVGWRPEPRIPHSSVGRHRQLGSAGGDSELGNVQSHTDHILISNDDRCFETWR
jgi:hypothetical protein